MKVHASALTLLHWLAQRESASVSEITASGLMNSREASDVVRYAMRNGAAERINKGASARGSARYRSTGVPLPEPRTTPAGASFDGLLSAWGIAQEPPELPAVRTRVYQIEDNSQDNRGGDRLGKLKLND
ncbi:hypothetical protein E1N52_01615 [Paraburkholderia guartelaensis]|jgi:hypothetical protein|uniref:Uncharacterized protein n=1 Tax=Paraburkholderia guartelaensis TaxID=2546446 RepID=A0A4R5LM88_9BURK|nr:hypothetical protein [Paraburkholderia guartelaensis]TDG10981.1 hypothetical protein E1N52_01615 [Paraburkholderia guartelaensis]